MPYDSRTRQGNAAEAGDRFLPKLYRIYPEDVTALSLNIKREMRSRRDDAPLEFFFVCYKYGQQQSLSAPLDLACLNLSCVVSRPQSILFSTCHFAVTLTHSDSQFSLFWLMDKTARFLRSRKKVAKYPFMGLGEVGNVTSTSPQVVMAAFYGWIIQTFCFLRFHPFWSAGWTGRDGKSTLRTHRRTHHSRRRWTPPGLFMITPSS